MVALSFVFVKWEFLLKCLIIIHLVGVSPAGIGSARWDALNACLNAAPGYNQKQFLCHKIHAKPICF
jgi:hypothetical protein